MVTNFGTEVKENKTAIHELNHCFGAPDHYENGDTVRLNNEYGTELFDDECVHGLNKEDEDVCSNLIICDGCKMLIQAGLNSAAYLGGSN
jgi:hypothetical protein